jgi:osmotically-inducible protein OsmY
MTDDLTLQQNVQDELNWHLNGNAVHIGVAVADSVVALTGHVPSYADKYMAEKAAKRVHGVKAVANELHVKHTGDQLDDEDIAQACVSTLTSHYSVPHERIKVVVRDGWVLIDGTVEWQYQKSAAENAIRRLAGVSGVTSNIKIVPIAAPVNVKSKIEAAFKRNAQLNARPITVEANNSKVTLRGNVRSWSEWNEAKELASRAPGITEVENDLTVVP